MDRLRAGMKLQPDASGIETYHKQIHALGCGPESKEIAFVAKFPSSGESVAGAVAVARGLTGV